MGLMLEREYYLRLSDFDSRKKIKPSAVLDIFQEIAVEHAERLGIGMEIMLAKKLMWVLTKLKYQVVADPPVSSTIKARTWPLAPSKIGFQREYLISDENDNVLIKGSTEWVLMNSETRRFARVMDIFPDDWDYLEERNFPGKFGRAADFSESGDAYEICPGFSNIDVNGHVSNIKYADYTLDALNPGEDEYIDTFRIDFHREVQKDSRLMIYTAQGEDAVLAKGKSAEGEIMFSCEIYLK
ncbi:MAG: hypothetical protein J1G06_06180 [Oscillospiraceae bacterium]|nr:hypothetical protein [Oscillospiraceae bacterium]